MMRWGLACVLVWATFGCAAGQVRVTYLANEGVLLESGRSKVLIDALFRDSLGSYQRHSAEVQESLETGRGAFAGVGITLATHFHLDHWDAGSISRFLGANPKAIFAAPAPATAMMPNSQRSRTRSLNPAKGASEKVENGEISVDAFLLTHRTTPHAGYVVSLGSKRVFHLGDADASAANFEELLRVGAADVAIVPFWWLTDGAGAAFIRDTWKPKQVIAVHFGAGDMGSVPAVEKALAGVWVCTRQGESRNY